MAVFLRRIIALFTLLFLLSGEALALTITEARTRDTDNDGQVDRVTLFFDADLNPATVDHTDFTVSGYTTASAAVPGGNPSRVRLNLNPSGAPDTDATPTIGIAAGQTVQDTIPTILNDSFGGVVASDRARPVVLDLSTTTTTGNYPAGTNITITATLSESVNTGTLTLNFNNGASLVLNATGANTVSNTYNVINGDDTPDLSVTSFTNTLRDANNRLAHTNLPAFGAAKTIAIDTVDPVVNEITNLGPYQTTNTPAYTFSSSEVGTISYAGNCSSPTTAAVSGNNAVPFNALPEGVQNNCVVTVTDSAGNQGSANVSDFTVDTIAPVVDTVSISSNNALDTSLAKTNDTITVDFTFTEATTDVRFRNTKILDNGVNRTINNVAKTGSIARFTTGVENSEVVVPFRFRLEDQAGNRSPLITGTTDGSTVRFDRTQPMINTVGIVSTSQDGSAFLGDLPTYYAKQGDDITLTIQAMDYVDVLSMTGNLFGQVVNLTNTAGSTWEATLTNVNGVEGDVDFSITVTDKAGNQVIVTGPSDKNNKVVFDKTLPDNPNQTVDLDGAETNNYNTITSFLYLDRTTRP